MKLVSDAKDFWKWHSTHLVTIAAAFPLVWTELPEDIKAWIPPEWMPWVTVAILIGALVGRVRDQS